MSVPESSITCAAVSKYGDLCHCRSHLAAGLGAAAAHVSASFHLGILPHAIAVLGTSFTYFSTDPAGTSMKFRTTEHKVSTRLTNFSAVEHQSDMRKFSVHASLLQTVGDCIQADAVTVQAILNTLLHLLIHLVERELLYWHCLNLRCSFKAELPFGLTI